MSTHKKTELDARDGVNEFEEFSSDYHAPVLCNAVVDGLVTRADGIYVDGTVGGGGHAKALLARLSSSGRLIGLDRDVEALEETRRRLDESVRGGRLTLVRGNFADLARLLRDLEIERVDGVLLDLGVSSHQLDRAERGFSHRKEGRLDMRMDVSEPEDAREILNSWPVEDLIAVFRRYGEEPAAVRIARKLTARRPIETTLELAEIVRECVRPNRGAKSLSRVFQALRIAVNDELAALERVLPLGVDLLREGGRMAVISYHSLEDRRVKRYFRSGNFRGEVHRDIYGEKLSPLREITSRPIMPSEPEIEVNPRARSARLRIAERHTTTASTD